MNFINLGTLSGILGFLAVVNVHAQTSSQGNCTVFNWDQQPAYFRPGAPQRVSGAMTCAPRKNETHFCGIVANGDLQVGYTRNITSPPEACWNTPNGPQCFLHSIILNSVNSSLAGQKWQENTIGAIDQTVRLESGMSGYLNFTSLQRCFVGTLSNCTGGLQNGIVLEACAPVYHTVGVVQRSIMDGEYTVVNISESDVGKFSDPFANQNSGEQGVAGLRYAVSWNLIGLGMLVASISVLI